MTGVNSGIVKERKWGDNRMAPFWAGQNLVGRLGRALDDGDPHRQKNNIPGARTATVAKASPEPRCLPFKVLVYFLFGERTHNKSC